MLTTQLGPAEKILFAAGLWASTDRVLDVGAHELLQLLQRDEVGFINTALKEKLVPSLDLSARAFDWKVPQDISKLNKVYDVLTSYLVSAVSPLIDRLAQSSVSVLALKGLDLMNSGYSSELTRQMVDIDLLVRFPDIAVTKKLFQEDGWQQSVFDPRTLHLWPMSSAEMDRLPAASFQLAPFRKCVRIPELDSLEDVIVRYLSSRHWISVVGGDVYACLECDIHFNLAPDLDIRDIWDAPRQMTLPNGTQIRAQGTSNLLWFLAGRLYHETMMEESHCMRQLFDIFAVIAKRANEIDWQRVAWAATKYHLQPSVYYTFWHIREFLGSAYVPDEFIDSMDPCQGNLLRLHDWGDFLPKLLHSKAVAPLLGAGGLPSAVFPKSEET